MIYRGPGFLAVRMIRLLVHPFSRQQIIFFSLSVCRRSSLLSGEGGGSEGQSYAREKDWPSINHSLLFSVYQRESRIKRTIKIKLLTKLNKGNKKQKKIYAETSYKKFWSFSCLCVFSENFVAAFSMSSKSESILRYMKHILNLREISFVGPSSTYCKLWSQTRS
jgi:hypothetical protein